MKPAKVLRLARRAARDIGAVIEEDPRRGKGSHRRFVVRRRREGRELGEFTLTGHNREISWTVLNDIETRLTPLFGEKWTEER